MALLVYGDTKLKWPYSEFALTAKKKIENLIFMVNLKQNMHYWMIRWQVWKINKCMRRLKFTSNTKVLKIRIKMLKTC